MRLSVFQGTVLVSAAAFTARYPSEEGYRMFLVDCPPEDVTFVQKRLSGRLARVGMDVTRAPDRLVEFYSVESTYLGMFLVLGGLGLLLGTIGMGIVVLRNVLERRTELALLRCVGFTPRAVARVVLAEHWMLLLGGVGIGVASSVLAIWPNLTAADSSVPYAMIAAILGGVLVVGLLWIAGAARLALRGSLLSALRNE
jgi:ABC-type antimicrobial peptide transport system permease subunit